MFAAASRVHLWGPHPVTAGASPWRPDAGPAIEDFLAPLTRQTHSVLRSSWAQSPVGMRGSGNGGSCSAEGDAEVLTM